ncbi:hypothetical protein [Marinomonas sp. 2405UD68-3]|uniref:hypothetical protein n=1 Tax=Marinomonas sp. 2405UD68-3 TaxID=3391835 RepID=UPI0039C9D5FB
MLKGKSGDAIYAVYGLVDPVCNAVMAYQKGMIYREGLIAIVRDKYRFEDVDFILSYVNKSGSEFNLKDIGLLIKSNIFRCLYYIKAPDDLSAVMYHRGMNDHHVKASKRTYERGEFSGDILLRSSMGIAKVLYRDGLGFSRVEVDLNDLQLGEI